MVGLPFQVNPVGSRIASASGFLDYSYSAALALQYGSKPNLDVLAYVDIVRPDAEPSATNFTPPTRSISLPKPE